MKIDVCWNVVFGKFPFTIAAPEVDGKSASIGNAERMRDAGKKRIDEWIWKDIMDLLVNLIVCSIRWPLFYIHIIPNSYIILNMGYLKH